MTPELFARGLLKRLSSPESDNNLASLIGLQAQEGGHSHNGATFNPMNVTQKTSTSHSINAIGIQAFSNWDEGLEATAKLLSNGLYKGVLSALARSAPPSETLREIATSPYGWYKMVGGKRVPLPYPAATAAAAAWRTYGAIEFPGGGTFGTLLATPFTTVRDLFTSPPSTKKTAAAIIVGVGALAGLALLIHVLKKSKAKRSSSSPSATSSVATSSVAT